MRVPISAGIALFATAVLAFPARALTPNDQWYNDRQWYLKAPTASTYSANIAGAWDITTGTTTLTIAVVGTGHVLHEDIDEGRVVPGYDFIGPGSPALNRNEPADGGRDTDPSDPGDYEAAGACGAGTPASDSSWWGLMTEGILGAKTNNTTGIAGINWKSKLLPVRFQGACGAISTDQRDAMLWAAGIPIAGAPANANPAKVLVVVGGGYVPVTKCDGTGIPQSVVDSIIAKGAVITVGLGNDLEAPYNGGFDWDHNWPANCRRVINVAALNRNGGYAGYTVLGPPVDISAPGGDFTDNPNGIYTTSNNNIAGPPVIGGSIYRYFAGTDVSADIVGGVASLMLSTNPALTPAQVHNILLATARPFPTGTGSDCTITQCGAGIVDGAAAVAMAASVKPQLADNIPPSLSQFYVKGCDGNYAETTVSSTGTPDFTITIIDTGTAATGLRVGSGTHVGGTAAMSSAVLLLHFDAGAVNIDSTVYHNAVSTGGLGSVDGPPEYGKALNWPNGTSGPVVAFKSDNLDSAKSQLTFQAWVNPTDVAAERTIFQWGEGAVTGPTLRLRMDQSLYANLRSSDSVNHEFWSERLVPPFHPSLLGKWSLITLTYGTSGSNYYGKLYVNDIMIASVSYSAQAPLHTSGNLFIGRNGFTGASWYGDMDEVRLLNRAMPDEAEAVAGDYYAGQFHYTVMGSTGPFIVRHITG
ncbi:MAG: S8 family serine peptidase, partial [Elusimicrobia bacterium]|nr:S8 family serine peptidase [Elusimicrobiota bacterium]